jgi:ADP-ribose pyrophosphatase YjhB (NUDIX family)
MYVTRLVLDPVESQYGRPAAAVAQAEFGQRQFDLVARCAAKNRAHDVTLFIQDEQRRFAVARKHGYPPDVFRPPSGGVEPGESFEAGALREAAEETGLEIKLERYVLRIDATFTCAGASAPWVSHVVLARCVGGALAPTDVKEIAEARWATVDELMNRYRPGMLAMGSAGMRYRVDLQDFTLQLLGLASPSAPETGRVIRFPAHPIPVRDTRLHGGLA